jgi:hypothetical protein
MEDFRLIINDPPDKLFFKDAIQMILKAGSRFLQTYRMPPDKILFHGKTSKPIYDYIIEKQLNLNAEFEYHPYKMNEEISIRSKTKVKEMTNLGGYSRGESLNGKIVPGWVPAPPPNIQGPEIIRERQIEPEVIIALQKI